MKSRALLWVAPIVPLSILGGIVLAVRLKGTEEPPKIAAPAQPRDAVVAQARLEPEGGVIHIGAPLDCVLSRLLVKEGQYIKAGTPLADLTTHQLRSSEREAAALRIARASLGGLGVEAQEAQIKSMQVDATEAERERERRKSLVEKGAIASAELEKFDTRVTKIETETDRARTLLTQLQKNTDVEKKEAIRALAVADALLEQTVIRAPSDGEVLRLVARAGERPGPQGVLVLGDTHRMTAVAEVHANDVRLVQVGQRAKFTSPALAEPIAGHVERIGKMVYRNNVFGEDPSAPENLRVFEVRVVLDSSDVAGRYTNLEGQVRIDLVSPPVPPSTDPQGGPPQGSSSAAPPASAAPPGSKGDPRP